MEALSDVIFERTPLGASAVKLPNDQLPRRLRMLLLTVDGRSSVANFVPFLTALAPLSEKFAELEQLGYLQRKGSKSAQASDTKASALDSEIDTVTGPAHGGLNDVSAASGVEAELAVLATGLPSMQTVSVTSDFEQQLQELAQQLSASPMR